MPIGIARKIESESVGSVQTSAFLSAGAERSSA
jgi:hypothetical protein